MIYNVHLIYSYLYLPFVITQYLTIIVYKFLKYLKIQDLYRFRMYNLT